MTGADDRWLAGFWRRSGPEPPATAPVAFGGRLTPALLLSAHRQGLYPIPCEGSHDAAVNAALYGDQVAARSIRTVGRGAADFALAWWSPDPRPVLSLDAVRLGSGLTKTLCAHRRWTTTVDRDFPGVLKACRAGRTPCWLTRELMDIMTELHHRGWYHSVEVWSGEDLVGGLVGLGGDRVFSADTMFHRVGGASQVAVVDLAARLADAGVSIMDLQWESPHLVRLGAIPMGRREFLTHAAESTAPSALPTDRRPVQELLDRLRDRPAPVGGGVNVPA
jgi:leucyl/phenylalanyl-tRNA--protein transferase